MYLVMRIEDGKIKSPYAVFKTIQELNSYNFKPGDQAFDQNGTEYIKQVVEWELYHNGIKLGSTDYRRFISEYFASLKINLCGWIAHIEFIINRRFDNWVIKPSKWEFKACSC
jgi:hypothetical protein